MMIFRSIKLVYFLYNYYAYKILEDAEGLRDFLKKDEEMDFLKEDKEMSD